MEKFVFEYKEIDKDSNVVYESVYELVKGLETGELEVDMHCDMPRTPQSFLSIDIHNRPCGSFGRAGASFSFHERDYKAIERLFKDDIRSLFNEKNLSHLSFVVDKNMNKVFIEYINAGNGAVMSAVFDLYKD